MAIDMMGLVILHPSSTSHHGPPARRRGASTGHAMHIVLRTSFLLCLLCLLAACGNKGDLVKPGTTPAPAKSEPAK